MIEEDDGGGGGDGDNKSTLKRFLHARDMNIENASEMYIKHQKNGGH